MLTLASPGTIDTHGLLPRILDAKAIIDGIAGQLKATSPDLSLNEGLYRE